MKIKVQGFMGANHSWSVIHWHMAREWKKMGHDVHLFATDGIKHLPKDLKENLIGFVESPNPSDKSPKPVIGRQPDQNYDMQFSYTAMKNARNYLKYGNKNRFNMWCYEWVSNNNKDILPNGFATSSKYCDKLLAPSTYVKDYMFIPAKISTDKIKVIPHGIDVDAFKKTTTIPLPTKKSFKILVNVTQAHLRKNIRGILESYGKAFTDVDDVCLILKTRDKMPKAPFEVSVGGEIKRFKKNFKNAPEVKIYEKFLDDISDLYRSVNCVYSLAHGEGFNMPLLESLAAGKLVVAPSLGGHGDFINKDNALLVNSSLVKADRKSMYWSANPNAMWVLPDVNDAAKKLQEAFKTSRERNIILESQRNDIYTKYSWEAVSKQVISLCE